MTPRIITNLINRLLESGDNKRAFELAEERWSNAWKNRDKGKFRAGCEVPNVLPEAKAETDLARRLLQQIHAWRKENVR